MKNCNEMVNSLLTRREQYETKKRNNRKLLIRTVMPICGICLVLLGIGIWQSGVFGKQPIQTLKDAIYPGIKDHFDVSKGESPDDPTANNKIVIHSIEEVYSNQMNIALMLDDFVQMDTAQINEYYGVNIFPAVPGDLKEANREAYGIYKRNGGKGELYWDQNGVHYRNEDLSRSVDIAVRKGALPYLFTDFDTAAEEKSIINNWEVSIGYCESSGLHAIYMYRDVGFYVQGRGLSQEEFVAVLSSIIQYYN